LKIKFSCYKYNSMALLLISFKKGVKEKWKNNQVFLPPNL